MPPTLRSAAFFLFDRDMAPTKTKRLSVADAAYVAGLIDGEGTVTLSREHRGEGRRLVVSIANTDASLLRFVFLHASGVGKITGKRTAAAHHTPSYAYRVTSRQALALLEQVAPYMRSYKKVRADFALANYLQVTPRNGKYSVATAKKRLEFDLTFMALVQEEGVAEPGECGITRCSNRDEELAPCVSTPNRSDAERRTH